MGNLMFYIIGGGLSLIGLSMLIDPTMQSNKYGISYDLAGVNVPIGIGLIVFGMYIIIAIRRNALKKK